VGLCKTGSQQACDTLNTPMEICSSYRCAMSQQKCTCLGKMHSPLLSAALQNSLQQACFNAIKPMRLALHRGLQRANRNALQHWSGQNAFFTVKWCAASQAHSRLVSLEIQLWTFAALPNAPRPCIWKTKSRARAPPACPRPT